MGYVDSHMITQTLDRAFAYAYEDKTENGKTYKTIAGGINCTPGTAYEVSRTLELLSKAKRGQKKIQTKHGEEPTGWHFQQDFLESPAELDPETAHEIGMKLAREMFPGFPVVVGTHTNTGHIHNHIVIGAWDMEGKKHNNSNNFYRKLRQASDRLCDEYGLHVLEGTRQVKLVKWTDGAGQPHYYEPTERKREARKEKQYTKADDYRDTEAFREASSSQSSNRQAVADDIDRLLNTVSSYGQLTARLRELGYQVRDRKKSGEWMGHISFKAPGRDRATREDKLGDGEYYTRKSLEKIIAALTRERLLAELSPAGETPPPETETTLLGNAAANTAAYPEDEERTEGTEMKLNETPMPPAAAAAMAAWEEAKEDARKKAAMAALDGTYRLIKMTVHDGDDKARQYRRLMQQGKGPGEGIRPTARPDRTQYLLDCINNGIRSLTIIAAEKITSAKDLEAREKDLSEKLRLGTATDGEKVKYQELRLVTRNLERIEREREKQQEGKRKSDERDGK